MLSLDSEQWNELDHAYGKAADVPALLRRLESFPASDDETWFALWSALAHQGAVYSASFAAVAHVVRLLASDPARADLAYFQFPAWVEICRQKLQVPVPPDLLDSYIAALDQLPALAAAALGHEREEQFIISALSAIAAAKGQPAIAEIILELDGDVTEGFWKWFYCR